MLGWLLVRFAHPDNKLFGLPVGERIELILEELGPIRFSAFIPESVGRGNIAPVLAACKMNFSGALVSEIAGGGKIVGPSGDAE